MSDCPYCQNSFEMTETCSDEFRMWQGLAGAYYTPSVDCLGNLSWTNTGELPNPDPVNIAGKGLNIVGITDDATELPETVNNYDAYLVGDNEQYSAYIYEDGTWYNIGIIGKGDTGVGIPASGTTGQLLAKKSNTNYDTEWINAPVIPSAATATPIMDGTASVGTATKYAREDHVHPSDTSKQNALVSGTNIKTINNNSLLGSGNITAVSSLNGETGTVVLDADGIGAMPKWVLLWTNASPMTSFAAQTIQLNLSGYDFVKIVFNWYVGQSEGTKFCQDFMCGEKSYAFRPDNGGYISIRALTISNSGIAFDDCIESQGTAASSTNNSACVPVYIYGIKGVITS